MKISFAAVLVAGLATPALADWFGGKAGKHKHNFLHASKGKFCPGYGFYRYHSMDG